MKPRSVAASEELGAVQLLGLTRIFSVTVPRSDAFVALGQIYSDPLILRRLANASRHRIAPRQLRTSIMAIHAAARSFSGTHQSVRVAALHALMSSEPSRTAR